MSTLAAPTTGALHRQHELLDSKHKSSSLAGIARTAAFGHWEPRERLGGKCLRLSSKVGHLDEVPPTTLLEVITSIVEFARLVLSS